MPVVFTKSSVITNADANPPVINSAQIANGRARFMRGVVAVANGDSIASVLRFVRVKSNDLVSQILLDCDAITLAAADIGIYRTSGDGGAVVDADLFASAQSIATALRATDVTRGSGVITVANMERPLWQLLGLSADPQVDYDIAATLTAAATAGGSVALSALVVGRN